LNNPALAALFEKDADRITDGSPEGDAGPSAHPITNIASTASVADRISVLLITSPFANVI
jgi:hypothetical protein